MLLAVGDYWKDGEIKSEMTTLDVISKDGKEIQLELQITNKET